MDMYEMLDLVLKYIYIYMNIIDLSVSVKSNRLPKINEIKTE